MSIRQMVKAWGLKVSHAWLLVLLALADHADDAGRSVRPSVAYLAWKTGYTERQVRRIMAGLRARGALVVVRPAAQHRPVEYRLRLEVLPVKTPFRSTDKMSGLDERAGVTSGGARGDIRAARPDTGVSQSFSTDPSETEPSRVPTPSLLNGNGKDHQGMTPEEAREWMRVRFSRRKRMQSIVDPAEARRREIEAMMS